jgi:AcrR family transcriptional regulator
MANESPARESRRVRYTRSALQESLLSLLEELPINKITISMVCLKADVHRSTFYMYYKDVYDLLEQIENALYEELVQAIASANEYLPSGELLKRAYEVVYHHRKLSKVLFGKYGNKAFLHKVADIYRGVLIEEWKKMADHLDPSTLDYIHSFVTFTNMGIMEKWISTNLQETPEELAKMASKFLMYGISSFLTMPETK